MDKLSRTLFGGRGTDGASTNFALNLRHLIPLEITDFTVPLPLMTQYLSRSKTSTLCTPTWNDFIVHQHGMISCEIHKLIY